MIGGLAATRKAELNRGVTAVAAAPERRPAWQLLIPLVAGLLVAETLGIIARELVVAPGA